MRKMLASLLVVGLLAGSAGAVISAEWVNVAPGANYPAGGYTTWDLMVTTGTNFGAAQMHLVPDAPGRIYQHAGGTNIQPTDFLLGFVPEVAWDTFVTYPPDFDDIDLVSTQTAVDLAAALAIPVPPAPSAPGHVDTFSIGWAASSGLSLSGPGTHWAARVTLLEGTTGDLWFFAKGTDDEAAGTGVIHLTLPDFIPEPATLLVLALGGVLGLIRRR